MTFVCEVKYVPFALREISFKGNLVESLAGCVRDLSRRRASYRLWLSDDFISFILSWGCSLLHFHILNILTHVFKLVLFIND